MHEHNHKSGIIEIPAGDYTQQVIPVKAGNDMNARFVATLSDGTTAVEESGEWTTKFGERKPWVRLTQFAAKNKLHLTSLRLNLGGRTIHMPREKFDRFSLDCITPNFYSLNYHLEIDDIGQGGGSQTHFIDLAAHFDDFSVHYIQDVSQGNNSWVVVTQGDSPLVPSPRKRQ